MKQVAIYGASGHTGQLVAAELIRRGHAPVLMGRNASALEEVAARLGVNARTAVADVGTPSELHSALAGVDVVVNCAGPLSETAHPLALAAIARGAHYLDTNAVEQLTAKRLFDELSDAARSAGVAVVPGLATFGGLGDLLANVAAHGLHAVGEVTVTYLVNGWIPTRGSQATASKGQGAPKLMFTEGRFATSVDPPSLAAFDFGPPFGVRDVIAHYPGVDVATIPRHVAAERVTVQMTLSTIQAFRTQDPEAAAKATPAQRKHTDFLVVAEVVHANGVRRASARGADIYGFTAVMMATAVERMGRDFTSVGVLSPSQAFESSEFLHALGHHQLQVLVD